MKKLAILACLMVGVVACDEDADVKSHDVTVRWNISNLETCSQTLPQDLAGPDGGVLEFESVRVRLYNSIDDTELLRDAYESCDAFSYTVYDLEEGSYFVTLGAMATYDGVTLPYFQSNPDDGEIISPAPDDEPYDFTLSLGRGTVVVSWEFGKPGLCAGNGVSTLHIVLEGRQSAHRYEVSEVMCEAGQYEFIDVAWDVYRVSVEGYDESGTQVVSGSSDEDFKVRPGEVIAPAASDDPTNILLAAP